MDRLESVDITDACCIGMERLSYVAEQIFMHTHPEKADTEWLGCKTPVGYLKKRIAMYHDIADIAVDKRQNSDATLSLEYQQTLYELLREQATLIAPDIILDEKNLLIPKTVNM